MQPFRGLRPPAAWAAEVACAPYDVVSRADAKQLCLARPKAFMQVTRPESALSDAVDATAPETYRAARTALEALVAQGVLVEDAEEAFYVYTLTQGSHVQTGIVLQAAVSDYEDGTIKRHEYTRPDKENDRVLHMQAVAAQTGKVWLVHKDAPTLQLLTESVRTRACAADFVADDGVRHQLWCVDAPEEMALIVQVFQALGPLYIADGHHRAAAAARVAALEQQAQNMGPSSLLTAWGSGRWPAWASILAVAFPAPQMQILAYNRVVKDFGSLTQTEFLDAIREEFGVTQGKPDPIQPRQFGMYLAGKWSTLHLRPGRALPEDPQGRLDVSILQNVVLGPLLRIDDPRRDTRIDFVGGMDADTHLERRVDAGWAVAFKLCPPRIEDMFDIADAGEVMPPKSTWFEPKLCDGLVVSCFAGAPLPSR